MSAPDQAQPRPVLEAAGPAPPQSSAESVRDRVEELIERGEDHRDTTELDDTDLDTHERALLSNVLRLQGTAAYDVMVPRADIMAMSEDLTLDEAIGLIQKDGHSRYPVYRESLDDIAGMVHIKDVFAAVGSEAPFDIKAILRKPLFVVPSIPVLDLLLQMRQARIHMALVVDEYGGIDGLVTIEDLVETIVGDISDEHDEDRRAADHRAAGRHDRPRRPHADQDLRGEARPGADRGGARRRHRHGGRAGLHPGRAACRRRGELISHPSGLEFRVLDADPRRIRRLRVRPPGAEPQRAAAE